MSILKHIINYFVEGTRPIRAIEGILLVSSMLVFSSFIFFYELKGLIILLSIPLALVSIFASIHLKGCRGFYEMYLYEYETIREKEDLFHRFIIFITHIFETYLLIFAAFLFLFLTISYLGYNLILDIKLIVGTTAIIYAFISFLGHTMRLILYRKIKNNMIKKNINEISIN